MADRWTPETLQRVESFLKQTSGIATQLSPDRQLKLRRLQQMATENRRVFDRTGQFPAPRYAGDPKSEIQQREMQPPESAMGDPGGDRPSVTGGEIAGATGKGILAAINPIAPFISGVREAKHDAETGNWVGMARAIVAPPGSPMGVAVDSTRGAIQQWKDADTAPQGSGQRTFEKVAAAVPMGPQVAALARPSFQLNRGETPTRESLLQSAESGGALGATAAMMSPKVQRGIVKTVRGVATGASRLGKQVTINTPEALIKRFASRFADSAEDTNVLARRMLDEGISPKVEETSGSGTEGLDHQVRDIWNQKGQAVDQRAAVLDAVDGRQFDVRSVLENEYGRRLTELQKHRNHRADGAEANALRTELSTKLKTLSDTAGQTYQIDPQTGAVTPDGPIMLTRPQLVQAYRDLAGFLSESQLQGDAAVRSGSLVAAEKGARDSLARMAAESGIGDEMTQYHDWSKIRKGMDASRMSSPGGLNQMYGPIGSAIHTAYTLPKWRLNAANVLTSAAPDSWVSARQEHLYGPPRPPLTPEMLQPRLGPGDGRPTPQLPRGTQPPQTPQLPAFDPSMPIDAQFVDIPPAPQGQVTGAPRGVAQLPAYTPPQAQIPGAVRPALGSGSSGAPQLPSPPIDLLPGGGGVWQRGPLNYGEPGGLPAPKNQTITPTAPGKVPQTAAPTVGSPLDNFVAELEQRLQSTGTITDAELSALMEEAASRHGVDLSGNATGQPKVFYRATRNTGHRLSAMESGQIDPNTWVQPGTARRGLPFSYGGQQPVLHRIIDPMNTGNWLDTRGGTGPRWLEAVNQEPVALRKLHEGEYQSRDLYKQTGTEADDGVTVPQRTYIAMPKNAKPSVSVRSPVEQPKPQTVTAGDKVSTRLGDGTVATTLTNPRTGEKLHVVETASGRTVITDSSAAPAGPTTPRPAQPARKTQKQKQPRGGK